MLNPIEYTQFIAATGITDATQKAATLKLVKDLKSTGAWTKLKAIYPMVGGTSQSHKFNLKDSRDLNIAFRLNFSTGWTHSATGAAPNGTSAYANTFFNTLVDGHQDSASLGYYSRTDISAPQTEIGVASTVPEGSIGAYLIYSYSGSAYKAINSIEAIRGSLFSPTTGLLITTRVNNTIEKYHHKGILKDTISIASQVPLNKTVYLGTYNSSLKYYSTKECAFAFIGDGLTDADALNLYTAITAFQTTLGRAI